VVVGGDRFGISNYFVQLGSFQRMCTAARAN
jgi:hypothetical protein